MKLQAIRDINMNEEAASHLIEYLTISGVLIILLVITMLTVNGALIEQPRDDLLDHAFIDIGNGVSTRIVDVYVISPDVGDIQTKFDIPDEVAGRDYTVQIAPGTDGTGQLTILRGSIQRKMSLSGIGATKEVNGSTTSSGLNQILYNSEGFS
jgi:hypothetical protein